MDLLNESVVRRIIGDIETGQNKERREREIQAFEVYSGELKSHVEDRIKGIYPKTYGSFSIADLNMSKKITDKLSKAYKQAPIRSLGSDGETQEYSDLMQHVDAASAWQTFDIYYNLHRNACMWFSFVEVNGEQEIVLRPLAPFQYSRVVDNIGETKVFIVNFPSSELYSSDDTDGHNAIIQDSQQDTNKKRYALWTKDQHVVVNCEFLEGVLYFSYEEIEGNPDSINELGMIPACFAQQGDNAALPISNPLTNQTIEFNQQYSVMLTGASLQTFGHLVLSHPSEQAMPSEIYNSLFTYSKLPQVEGDIPTTLDYLNPSPNLDSQLQVLQNYGHQIISEHLGDGAQTVDGSSDYTSGLDRMIAMSDITGLIESNQQVYSKCENVLYNIIKAFYDVIDRRKFTSPNIAIKYSKAKPIESEAEILLNIEKKLAIGLIEKYEALMMLDPNITVENAKSKIDIVNIEKKKNIDTLLGGMDANKEE
jgi:hypothetical protein